MDLKALLGKAETVIEAAAAPTGGGASGNAGIEAAQQRLTACMMAMKDGSLQPAEMAAELKAIAGDLNTAASGMGAAPGAPPGAAPPPHAPPGVAPPGAPAAHAAAAPPPGAPPAPPPAPPGAPPPAGGHPPPPKKKPPVPGQAPGSAGPPGMPAAGYKSAQQKLDDCVEVIQAQSKAIVSLQKQLDPVVELKVTLSALRDTCWDLSDALRDSKIDVAKKKIADIGRMVDACETLMKKTDTEKAAETMITKRATKKQFATYISKQLARAQAEEAVPARKRLQKLATVLAIAKASSWEDDGASVDFTIEEAYIDTADGGKEQDLTSIDDQESDETKADKDNNTADDSIATNFEEVVKATDSLLNELTIQPEGDGNFAASGGQPGHSPLAKAAPKGGFEWPLDLAAEAERPDDFDAKRDPWTQLQKRAPEDDLSFGRDPESVR